MTATEIATETRQEPKNNIKQGQFRIGIYHPDLAITKNKTVETIEGLKYELEWGFLYEVIRLIRDASSPKQANPIRNEALDAEFNKLKQCFSSDGSVVFEHMPELIGKDNILESIAANVHNQIEKFFFSDIRITITFYNGSQDLFDTIPPKPLEQKVEELETIVFMLNEKITKNYNKEKKYDNN